MHSSQEISSSDPQLSIPSSSKISPDLKEKFYQSFLAMNEKGMAQLIEAHGLEVVYSDFDFTYDFEDFEIENSDPISRMAFICDEENRFNLESCQIFLKLLNQEQRIKIIESINLSAFLDEANIKHSLQKNHNIQRNLKDIGEAKYLENHVEKDDFKKHWV